MRATDGRVDTIKLPNMVNAVPSYSNVPMLTNDWITSDESKGTATTLSSVYLVNLDSQNGFYLGCLGGANVDVQASPRDASVLGFRIYELGQSQAGANSQGRRLAWYGGCALGSTLSAARAKEIITG
jgi:hypothetical protein